MQDLYVAQGSSQDLLALCLLWEALWATLWCLLWNPAPHLSYVCPLNVTGQYLLLGWDLQDLDNWAFLSHACTVSSLLLRSESVGTGEQYFKEFWGKIPQFKNREMLMPDSQSLINGVCDIQMLLQLGLQITQHTKCTHVGHRFLPSGPLFLFVENFSCYLLGQANTPT